MLQSPEKGPSSAPSSEQKQIVLQPGKTAQLEALLGELDAGDVSEELTRATGEEWAGGGAAVASTTQGQQQTTSPRAQAIRNLPAPKVMQREITKHITKEIRTLRGNARTIIRIGKPGEAYRLSQIYARIRQLNGLIAQLWEASFEVVKRLFIRIFIDKLPVL